MLLRGNAELNQGKLSSIATLERVTTLYPDDAEAWYLLGEAYYHNGGQALHPRSKFVRAFERSVELDPSFGAAYIHLVWEQFSENDSSSAKRLIRRFRQIDSTSAEAIAFDVFYALVWGDPPSRNAARSALDTLETDELLAAELVPLTAPQFWEQRQLVLGALLGERHPREERENAQRMIAWMHLGPGHFRQAREALLAAGEEGFGVEAASMILAWRLVGYSDSSTTRRAARVLAGDSTARSWFLLGALAVDEGRWEDVDRALGTLERGAPTGDPSRDSLEAIARPAMARALRGYTAARRGDAAAAINDLGEALKGIPGHCPSSFCNLHSRLRYTMGRVLLDAGRPAEAVRYLSSVNHSPAQAYAEGHGVMSGPSELYLGEAYEALGDLDEARRHYARFVSLWKDSDPELRSLWEEGRQALQRLTGVQKL